MQKILKFLIFLLISASAIAETKFTHDWFSANIPDWNKYKPLFEGKENKNCLEIGSFEGKASIYIIENYCNGKNSHLDAVDTWEGSVEHSAELKQGLYDRFYNNLKRQIESKKVIPYKGKSSDILMRFIEEVKENKRQKYDFIYIDASHIAKDVLMDAVLAWELLKIDGIMVFDDYEWLEYNNHPYMKPKPAIDGFLASYDTSYEILLKKYQVHLKKISDNPKY